MLTDAAAKNAKPKAKAKAKLYRIADSHGLYAADDETEGWGHDRVLQEVTARAVEVDASECPPTSLFRETPHLSPTPSMRWEMCSGRLLPVCMKSSRPLTRCTLNPC